MRRFLAVERTAAEEIVQDRQLQSIQFEAGRNLASVLRDLSSDTTVSSRIDVVRHSEGTFFLPKSDGSLDYTVFDMNTCGLFLKDQDPQQALTCFQKVLRFALKRWNSQSLSITEYVIPSSTKGVVFPYPQSLHTEFRISIELAPDAERQKKRSGGHCLLVYRSGKGEGKGSQEEVSPTNFRKFDDARRNLAPRKQPPSTVSSITAMTVTQLERPEAHLSPFQGYDGWLQQLTDPQRKFVLSELNAPHRIEGPAGTGKTLSLVLKAIHDINDARDKGREFRALFMTHSEATRRTIEQLFEVSASAETISDDRKSRSQSLKLTTLQALCAELLQQEIAEDEFIDKDAFESKQYQMVLVADAFQKAWEEDYPTYKNLLSPRFDAFLNSTERWALAEMLQHEIGVLIKGRADDQLDNYRKLPPLRYGLPAESVSDRGFVWLTFKYYQAQLQRTGQFDTDDIVITTMKQLDTPIWRRRRSREGYDAIYIDETHLFNMNELSVFHHLTKSTEDYPIAYSVDRSQAIGDRGWSDSEILEQTLASRSSDRSSQTSIKEIFRSSPEIVNLAFSVTASGATLFTNFDNPLAFASSMLTHVEERKCSPPKYLSCGDDEEMVGFAFTRAEEMVRQMGGLRASVALVAFSDDLFLKAQEFSKQRNKPVEVLKERGDIEVVHRAEKSGRFVLSAPEYIGGLEFDGVVLLGVDEGRVPPSSQQNSVDSANFLSYASHNRLYVTLTRARYRVEIIGAKERGPSPLLSAAIAQKLLQVDAC
jgi:superfamily I DNA/RNA helicase